MKNLDFEQLKATSIKLKLIVMYLLLVFIVMIFSGTFMLTSMRNDEKSKYVEGLKRYSEYINDQIVQRYKEEDFQQGFNDYFQNGFSQYSYSLRGYEGYILTSDGKTIAGSNLNDDEQTVTRPQFKSNAIISSVSGTSKSAESKDIDKSGLLKSWIDFANPVVKSDINGNFIIYTRTETTDMNLRLGDVAKIFLLSVLLALILTAILGFLFTNTLTIPIIKLTKKAKEIASGNFDEQIPVYSNDEIGQLTDSFNFMSKELNQMISAVASEKNKLEVILENMTDGILAYDSDGHLIHANNACYELLNETIEQLSFSEMMSLLGLKITKINEIQKDNINPCEVDIHEKHLSVSFTSYKNKFNKPIGLVIVLQDITKLKKLDNMRKEFVANVSHEIRTPLTTIKTYAETLLDGALEDQTVSNEFLNIIISETDRMTLLTKDLLDLSKFDNEQFLFEFKKINLTQILVQSIKQNIVIANQKKQEIACNLPEEYFYIDGDGARINQVFTNIISNAIKYSPDNTKIEIRTEQTDKYYRIFIKDNGIGIPKEDLNRIFERFYRVDKARSRKVGGTGLGLSIAKVIMEAHKGKIFAISEPNKGTTMILRFPRHFDEE